MHNAGQVSIGTAAERGGLAPIRAGRPFYESDTGLTYIGNEAMTAWLGPIAAIGSGVANQVAIWSATNQIIGDAGFTYDPAVDTITLAGGFVLTGAAAAIITVNDDGANALTLVDAGGIEYLRYITTNAQPVVVWNEGGADIDFRWEASGVDPALFIQGSDGFVGVGVVPTGHLHIENLAISTTASYDGTITFHDKTAGATDHNDTLTGLNNRAKLDQVGGEISNLIGFRTEAALSNGSIGDAGNQRTIWGFFNLVNLDGGEVFGNVFGFESRVDTEGAMTGISGDIMGARIWVDADEDPGGLVYMLYFAEFSNIDYCLYQDGSAASSLGGDFYWHGDGSGLLFGSMYAAAEIIVPIGDANPNEVENAAQDGWTAGELNGVTFPTGGTEHYLTITIAGRYEIIWSMSFHIAAGAGASCHGGVMIDGVAIRDNGETDRDVANLNDTGNMATACILDLPNGTEEISLWILNGNSNDIHVVQTTVTVKQIGGT